MRLAAVALLAMMTSGCATSPSDLARFGVVELESQNVKSLSITREGSAKAGSIPKCVAITIRNDSVAMTQSSGYVGAYTGSYYQASSIREVSGGSVTQYVAPDGSEVVARGEAKFTTSLVERSLRYTLNITQVANQRTYKFTGIEQAGTTNGYGYHKIAARTGTGVEQALESLSAIVDELEYCMK